LEISHTTQNADAIKKIRKSRAGLTDSGAERLLIPKRIASVSQKAKAGNTGECLLPFFTDLKDARKKEGGRKKDVGRQKGRFSLVALRGGK